MPPDPSTPNPTPDGRRLASTGQPAEAPLDLLATTGQPLGALLDLLALDALPRTGWVLRGVHPPESIAGHVLGVAHVALALAPRVDPPLDLARVLAMAIVHDAPEARSGDLPRPAARHLPAGAKRALESGLAAEIVAPLSPAAHAAFEEYESQATAEARFVKACDRLQLGVRLLGYERAGWRGLGEFWASIEPNDSDESGETDDRGTFAEFAPCEALAASLLIARRDAREDTA